VTSQWWHDYPPPRFRVPVVWLTGDALGHLIDYARKWKPENDRIRAAKGGRK
jgi:hypothetical protein